MEITLPTSWDDIKLPQFIEIYDLLQDESLDKFDKSMRIISILSRKKVEELEKVLTLKNIKLIDEKLRFIYDLEMGKPLEKFSHAGYKWKVNMDISKILASDYISLCHFTKEKENIVMNLPNILAIFCKPVKRKWGLFEREVNIEYSEKVNLLSEVSIAITYPIAVFFCNFWKHYIEITGIYLAEELAAEALKMEKQERPKEELNLSMNTGAG